MYLMHLHKRAILKYSPLQSTVALKPGLGVIKRSSKTTPFDRDRIGPKNSYKCPIVTMALSCTNNIQITASQFRDKPGDTSASGAQSCDVVVNLQLAYIVILTAHQHK